MAKKNRRARAGQGTTDPADPTVNLNDSTGADDSDPLAGTYVDTPTTHERLHDLLDRLELNNENPWIIELTEILLDWTNPPDEEIPEA